MTLKKVFRVSFAVYKMLDQEIPSNNILGVNFSIYTAEDIKKLSVKKVTNPQSFDALGHPTIGGLYDPAFGLYTWFYW